MYQGLMSAGSFALYPMTFYELQPVYLCKGLPDTKQDEWTTCKPEDFCDNPEIQSKVDTANILSLENWVGDYDMKCSPKYQFGLFGSLFFFAVVIGSFLFTPLADKIGRRKVCLIGEGVTCLAQTLLVFSSSRVFSYFIIFVLGLSMPMRVFVGYIYAMEFMPLNKT